MNSVYEISGHTPGPWRTKRSLTQMCDDGTTVASLGGEIPWWIFSDADTHGDREADARLVSAAPELLAALRFMVEVFGPGVDSYGPGAGPGEIDSVAQARAAIAAAEGR